MSRSCTECSSSQTCWRECLSSRHLKVTAVELRLPLEVVDSLRVGNKERGFFRTAGLVLGIGAVWAYLTRGIGGD